MKIGKFAFKCFLLVGLLAGFASCSDDDDNNETPEPVIPPIIKNSHYGAYVLSSGIYGDNAGVLYYYDLESNQTEKAVEAFAAVNGMNMGDTSQDMIVYGNKMYFAMYNSGLIYVTDKNAKIISTIRDDQTKLQPRSFETLNGKVYVTLMDGYLARIDTATLTIDKRIAVGPNPEAVKAVRNKLYVANSGGLNANYNYNTTVSIVDPELTTHKEIEVVMNPNILEKDNNNNLYLISRGNYGYAEPAIDNALQMINTETEEVTVLDKGRAFDMFLDNDKLYVINKTWTDGTKSTLLYYDINNNKMVEESFITDGTEIADISNVSIEPTSGDYYVTVANGTNNGDVYIFSADGKFKSKFDTGSAYPMGVWFVKK